MVGYLPELECCHGSDTGLLGRTSQGGHEGKWPMREQLECVVLCPETCDEPAESLWVMISGQTNVYDVVVGICCRLPDQGEADKAFFRQVEDALCSQTSVLLGDSNCLICCKGNTAGHEQSRMFLEWTLHSCPKMCLGMKEDWGHLCQVF